MSNDHETYLVFPFFCSYQKTDHLRVPFQNNTSDYTALIMRVVPEYGGKIALNNPRYVVVWLLFLTFKDRRYRLRKCIRGIRQDLSSIPEVP